MAERLKHCRRQYGWTQRDLAHVSGVGIATIRRIEQDEFAPRLETVRHLAETLHVRAGWLAFGEQPMLDLRHMTADEQYRLQAELGKERHPGDVTDDVGPWCQDGDAWHVDQLLIKQVGSGER